MEDKQTCMYCTEKVHEREQHMIEQGGRLIGYAHYWCVPADMVRVAPFTYAPAKP